MILKDTFWFRHDYNARGDRKLLKIIHKHGIAGYGIYWFLVEMLYEEGGYLPLCDCDCYANAMRTQCDIVKDIINGDLFENDGVNFWSNSCLRRLENKNEKSEKAKKSALVRWHPSVNNANAMRTQCDSNAREERRGEERRREDIDNINIIEQHDVFLIFEENVCQLTPVMADKLKLFVEDYSEDWVIEAIKETANNNAHSIKYTQAILERWRKDGYKTIGNNGSNPTKESGRRRLIDYEEAQRRKAAKSSRANKSDGKNNAK